MKRKTLFNLLLGLGLVLALGVGMVSSSNRALAQDVVVQGEASIQATVGTAFTYQGRLIKDGNPVNGTCDFQFTLWDAASGGNQVGGTESKTNVTLTDGNFSVGLDFGASAFEGDARFLQIGVRCPAGSGSYTTLSGRVSLLPAPYAHSLRPGAIIEGDSAETTLSVWNTRSLGAGVAGQVGTASGKVPITGAAVWGDSADRPGVFGTSNSAGGVGGWSTSGPGVSGISDSSTGVSGASNSGNGVAGASTSGYGVHGTSTSGVGVYGGVGTASGKSPITGAAIWGDSADRPGVFGTSHSAGGVGGWSTSGPGVTGISVSGNGVAGASTSGNGVHGTSTSGYGVYGEATANSGTTYGVYGKSNSATDGSYGGYFTGYGGVYGKGTGILGAGVRGESTDEAGGYFTSTNDVGVFGRSENSWGMYGYAAGTSGTTYGVYGRSDSGTGYGVYGYSASNHGVHGTANPPDGYGIYSEGNAYVEGKLFWDAKTSYVAVATSAFIPELYGDIGHVEYDNEGYYLKNESSNAEWFTAQAQLPHGATVRELRVGWRDGSDETATLYLKRRSMLDVTQGAETMAVVSSVGSFGSIREGVWSDDTIDGAGVQNDNFTYYLEVYLPSTSEDIKLYGVVIEYEITQPY